MNQVISKSPLNLSFLSHTLSTLSLLLNMTLVNMRGDLSHWLNENTKKELIFLYVDLLGLSSWKVSPEALEGSKSVAPWTVSLWNLHSYREIELNKHLYHYEYQQGRSTQYSYCHDHEMYIRISQGWHFNTGDFLIRTMWRWRVVHTSNNLKGTNPV